MPTAPERGTPSVENIRDVSQKLLKKRPCLWQVRVAQHLARGKDVVCCVRTGAGKTLSFWLHLALSISQGLKKISLVVTPLNLLGKQNALDLTSYGIPAIAISKENASAEVFQAIGNGQYRAVIINPELLTDSDGEMSQLFGKSSFTSKLLNVIFDEGHCVSTWAGFRGAYGRVGMLRYMLPDIPFYVASATLPSTILADVLETLNMQRHRTEFIQHSNDRPDIYIKVQEMMSGVQTFKDLALCVPDGYTEASGPLDKFVAFFDKIVDTEGAVRYLRSRLPNHLAKKIRWFHATMTNEFRDEHLESFRSGETWGLCVTDAFGMGMDLPDIKLVIQYKATCDLCTLWQRFGRGARGLGTDAVAILLVEKKDLESERQAKAERAVKRAKAKEAGKVAKRKRNDNAPATPAKRVALADLTPSFPRNLPAPPIPLRLAELGSPRADTIYIKRL
ncbi:P-loop containing nucleoside triphosphate hydrolase protein [Ephemerocybe angulata]|uniref:DNA 3'-5' helicase n=1 Tax=Ephemerocybe angulata TaxID=980116 RepID=A0A8H6IHS0_9AGAR|nr:P-loop containing nucleoside triphosphate hydrolase protein [Tulosesus angulatus]